MNSKSNISGVLSQTKIDETKQKDAVLLTEENVLKLRLNKIENYQNANEIWSLKNGTNAIGIASLATTSIINLLFNRHFKIKGLKGFFSLIPSTMAVSIIPSAVDSLITSSYFTHYLLISKKECMLCREIKTIGMHIGLSTIMPAIFGFMINFSQAESLSTYPTPKADNLFKSAKERRYYFKETKKIFLKSFKAVSTPLFYCFAFQLIFCSALLYRQQVEFKNYIEHLEFTKNEITKVKYNSE